MTASRWRLRQLVAVPLVVVACGRPSARPGIPNRGPAPPPPGESPATPAALSLRPPDSLLSQPVESLLALGERVYLRGGYDTARAVWSAALARSRAQGDSASVARALTWLGLAAWRTGDYRSARRLGEQALQLKQRWALRTDLFKSYNALGLLAWNEGRLADATELFGNASAAARAAGDRRGTAAASGNLALVETELGEFAEARRGFDSARVAGHTLGDARVEGNALTNLGMLDIRVGAPQAATAKLREARRIYAAIPYPLGEQNALAQLGTAYAALGEPSLAFAAVDSALVLSRKEGLRQEEAGNLEALADLYHDAGDAPRALTLYGEAGTINAQLGLLVEAGGDLRSEAEINADLGAPERARQLAGAALDTHRGAGARFEELGDRLLLADLAARAGDTAGTVAQLAAARGLAQQLAARRARVDVALAEARIADRQGDADRELRAVRRIATDLVDGAYGTQQEAHRLAMRAFARLGQLDSAAAAGGRAVAALERTRERHGSGILRTTYLAGRQSTYADLVQVLRRLGRTGSAFSVADGGRGRAMLEALADSSANSSGLEERTAVGQRMLLRIDALAEELRTAESEGTGDADTAARAKVEFLRARLEAARGDYERQMIGTQEASARPGRGTGVLPDAAAIRRVLRADEALLEYFVADDSLIIFVATPNRVASSAVGVTRGQITTRVRLARELIVRSRHEPTARLVALDSLYVVLIEPARHAGLLDGVRRLFIVPHGALTYLPFAALRRPGTGRYLVQDFALVALPSAAVLTALRARGDGASAPAGAARVFAPEAARLPGTAVEAEAVGRALGEADVLAGSRATEGALRRGLASPGLVHLATHAEMNAHNPLFSYIALARQEDGGPEGDGRLEVHEIIGLHIASSLVFLSGCETALGPGAATDFGLGEDYATLSRAFLYAGARDVVATLWRVEDRGAAELAARFYRGLPRQSAAEALATAQRDLLSGSPYRSPYYWAGYVLSGEGGGGPQNQGALSVR